MLKVNEKPTKLTSSILLLGVISHIVAYAFTVLCLIVLNTGIVFAIVYPVILAIWIFVVYFIPVSVGGLGFFLMQNNGSKTRLSNINSVFLKVDLGLLLVTALAMFYGMYAIVLFTN